MSVTTFFIKVQLSLVADKQLVAAVPYADGRGVGLVTVADTDAMEVTADERRHTVGRAVGHTCIEHALLESVLHTGCHIHPVARPVGTCQHRGVYCQ